MLNRSCLAQSCLKFSSIVPDDANIFIDQNEDLTGDQITEYIRLYLRHLINYLSLFVSQNDMLKRKFECNVKKYLNLLARDEQKSDVYKFQKNPSLQNVNLGRCYYCHLADYKYKSSSEPEFSLDKKFNEYSKFCTRFGLIGSDTSLKLDTNFAEKYPNLTNLLLINVPLCIDSPVFFKLFNSLIEVKLLNNDLELLPDSLLEIDGLKTLSFNNRLKSDNLSFEHLTSLEFLELENLELKKNNKIIHLPGSIKTLKVSRSSFDYFCFDLNPESIVELKLSGIPLMDMDKYGKIDSLISFDNLKNEFKKSKIIKEYQVRKLFNNFDWNSNGYLETREITKINAFIFKKYLRLGPNIPEIIFKMVNIKTLDLSFQSIEQIPDEIENLKNLKSLILNNCILLENISPKLANLSINKLDLNNCLSLVTPPSEVVKRGFNSVLTYLKRLLSGSVELKRTKLMLVGLGQAGKTSLLRTLKGEQCDESTELTDGIEIDDWIIDLEDGSNLTFSMWDFAGQSVYYNTHQFFLSSRGVYLLVWNVRLGSEYAGLEFWLSSISVHAPGAPVFVVGTHVDQVFKYTLDEEDLKSRFKDIVGFHFVSSKTGEGIEQLKQKIIEATLEEKYIDEKIPAT
ncbi:serine threonine- kinase pats1 [Brachionus plicatilis]|uniref:Serine threonine-kinase pats1 n=1 Tax=Brachionus plicatilis TaxID=10195 RepID=A0A3M7SSC0_BRAPC|nr:serine threonine- kinase pats1 [Brachionus plicatilis]